MKVNFGLIFKSIRKDKTNHFLLYILDSCSLNLIQPMDTLFTSSVTSGNVNHDFIYNLQDHTDFI